MTGGRILIVEDGVVNRMLLMRLASGQGHQPTAVEDGLAALAWLDAPNHVADMVLLDLEMPRLDGYETLRRMKQEQRHAHLPVVVISAVDDLAAVVRCIELGALDYLPKPVDPSILRARIRTGLTAKRLRDLELEYLEQVGHVIDASVAVEHGDPPPTSLATVAERDDALGQLARTFARMAREVQAREMRLRGEVRELRIAIDAERQERQVAEITESDYFRALRERAADLRQSIRQPQQPPN
jgi:two-component system cell cycle response regulator